VELVEWEGVGVQVVVDNYPVVLQALALALELVVVEVLVQLVQVQILDSVLEVEVVAMEQLELVVVVEVGAFVGDVVGSFHVEGAYLVVEGVVDCMFQLLFVVELVEWEEVGGQVVVGKYPVVLQALALELVVVEVLVQLEQVQILDSVLVVEVVVQEVVGVDNFVEVVGVVVVG
jgi:hypothetical protein